MSGIDKLGYVNVANTTATVKATPGGLFGVVCTGAGNVTIYDNASAGSGTILYTKTGAAAGDVVNFGGVAIAAKYGITVVATATVNVIYT